MTPQLLRHLEAFSLGLFIITWWVVLGALFISVLYVLSLWPVIALVLAGLGFVYCVGRFFE